MFTINIYLRFGLIALSLILGIALTALYGFWYAFPLFLVVVILAVGYFLLGTVQSASMMLQSGDFEGAEQRLNLTLSPKLLYVTNRAFYFMLKGSLASQRKDMDESEKWLKLAQALDLPSDNERAMVELQLANIAATKNKWRQAEGHFRAVKGMKITEPMLKQQVVEFEKAFNQRGQMQAQGRMSGGRGQMTPGGKRRRPKMR